MEQPLTHKTIHVATDHAGFECKEVVVSWLKSLGYKVEDHGAKTFDSEDDFPDYISLAAQAVSDKPNDSLGLIFGGSGQGEAMVANRFMNVRATTYYGGPDEIIELSKAHNDANMLSIGVRFVDLDQVKSAILHWLRAELLPDEKYRRRNQKIEAITRTIKRV